MSKFAFGAYKFRNLGKILLCFENINNINGNLIKNENIHYEHIFHTKYNKNNQTRASKEAVEKYNLLSDTEDKILDTLGNATILNGKLNKNLNNKNPFDKCIFIEKSKEESSFLNNKHLEYIKENKENWTADLIKDRSNFISKNITDFLFSDFI